MIRRSRHRYIGSYVLLSVTIIVAILPLLWTFWTSFKNQVDSQAYPPNFSADLILSNYTDLYSTNPVLFVSDDFLEVVINSIVLTVSSVTLAVSIAFLCAYALVRLAVPLRRLLVLLIVLVQTMPAMVLVVPLFFIAIETGFYDTHVFISLIYAALIMPFATWIIVAFIKQLPIELEEAARIDGASRIKLLLYIVLPLARPGVAAAAIFCAIGAWNEYLIPLFLTRSNARPLTVWITSNFWTQKSIEWGPLTAATIVVIAPIVLTVLLLQRHLLSGLTAGSVKG